VRATAAVGDPYGDLPGAVPAPVGGAMASAVLGMRDGLDGIRERFWSAMPRRQPRATEVTALHSRAETRRRAAMGLLALVVVVLVAGLVLALVPRGNDVTTPRQVAGSDSALSAALDATNRADNLLATDPTTALELYREAWTEIGQASSTGLSAPALAELEDRVGSGLDQLYLTKAPKIERLATLPDGMDPAYLVQGPRNGAIFIDRASGSVYRANLKDGKIPRIVKSGQKASGGKAIGVPVQLTNTEHEVIIVDDNARPFRWRPSNSAGAGTLTRISLRGRSGFEPDHGDVEAYDQGGNSLYRLYVAEPSLNQVLRYIQTLDGSSFDEPSELLASQASEVADFDQLYIDFDLYALFDDSLRRYSYGRYDGSFALGDLPDDGDLRPGHDYTIVDGSGTQGTLGRVYLYDAAHGRIVGFDKADGAYIGQWTPAGEGTEMDDVRGMYVVEGGLNAKGTKRRNDTLIWITPKGIYRATLPVG
jgi:hypothetical protein